MTGLDKILKAIEDEAKAGADAIIAQAQKEADEIMAAAKAEADKKCAQIAEKSASDVKAVLSRAESAAALQERKILLDAKQQMISNIITGARESLDKLPDSEYFDIIFQMVKKYAHNDEGKILFSSADQSRLPKDFDDKLKQYLSDKPNAKLTAEKEAVAIKGGFLLKYGDIEENCSFDALFEAAKENLQDKVNSLLFD